MAGVAPEKMNRKSLFALSSSTELGDSKRIQHITNAELLLLAMCS